MASDSGPGESGGGSDLDAEWSWDAIRSFWLDHLAGEGFRPDVDEDGDVHFKYEGGHYFLTRNNEADYFHLLFPQFWSIDSPLELDAAFRVANTVTSRMKVVKVYVLGSLDDVSASAEMFVSSPQAAAPHLQRCLRAIVSARSMFRDEMRESGVE